MKRRARQVVTGQRPAALPFTVFAARESQGAAAPHAGGSKRLTRPVQRNDSRDREPFQTHVERCGLAVFASACFRDDPASCLGHH
jgi:hypothetical protein